MFALQQNPIVVEVPVSATVGAQHPAPHLGTAPLSGDVGATLGSPDGVPHGDTQAGGAGPARAGALPGSASHESPASNRESEGARHSPLVTSHSLVLPSVPVDQLLDDHAVEFEECKRWANSDAGQAARMTNPAGFANVRAHAEAHLRAMQGGIAGTSKQ